MRRILVEDLKNKGISDNNVLNAINSVPRHFFLDSSFLEFAYQDKAFPIGSGQTISQPMTVAFQTSLLKIEKGMKVLEIGTGSGYQACVLAEMGAKVFTMERQRNLYAKTKTFLSEFNYNIKTFLGDGNKGLPTFGPFDRIIITAAAPEIPQNLVDQLKVGGIMVIPLSENEDTQTMLRLTKQEDGSMAREEYGDFRFVPMLKNLGND
ncbi:MAG: protein-L-isoaspartate(D-aspartate) O-methyltransferase [Bacteroidales bacterium]|nr:protein-L-isoaspartate(D-aspartate) O-methyltransferase [Bacteroidales bacterium]MBR5780546.1 protein-L-isoaspartate(D-aspartate) O-methyltransferase [Bacteroidales bacterium]